MPMMITGQKAIMTARQARFQIVDIVATMKPLTKSSRQIVSAASIPTLVRDAFASRGGRPGPVLLELPEDVAGEEVSVDVPLVPPHPIDLPAAHPEAVERAAAMIREAKRPLVMIGAGEPTPSQPWPDEFIHRIGIPFFNTQMGKGVIAGGTNLWMGTAALSERDYVHEAIDKADLIIAIGHDTVEKPPFIMGPSGPKVIHIGYTPANVEQVYFPHAEVIGDVACRSRCWPTTWQAAERRRTAPLARADPATGARPRHEDRFPPTPQRIVNDVRKVMPEDGIVCLDNGMYKIWFACNYRSRGANTLLLDNALATMGAGLPSAMMAKLLHPDRRFSRSAVTVAS